MVIDRDGESATLGHGAVHMADLKRKSKAIFCIDMPPEGNSWTMTRPP